MTQWSEVASKLAELLGLDAPPVALSFVDRPPEGSVAFPDPLTPPTGDGRRGRVPASCVFWMRAAESTFFTVPADHGNCSVGRWVHGFAAPEDIFGNDDVGALLGSGWVDEDAVGGIRTIAQPSPVLVYGPLGAVQSDPDVVILRLTPRQMMEFGDACPGLELSGKPQCQIVALAKEHGTVAVSMGCALSRERTGMPNGELTCAVPAGVLPGIVDRLAGVRRADEAVRLFAVNEMEQAHA